MTEATVPRIVAGACLATLVAATSGCVSLPDREPALLDANKAYDAALVSADEPTLRTLYRPEFVYIGPDGVLRDRTEQIRVLVSGEVDLLEGKSDEIVANIIGDAAVLHGRFTGRASVKGDEFSFVERYSTVWRYQNGRWGLVLEHGTVIRDE